MEIYIDGLFYKGSGIGRYYESLIKEFANKGIKVHTCIPERLRGDFEKDFSEIPNIKPTFVGYEKFSMKGFFKQSEILKKLEKEVNLFFYPYINLPHYIPKNTVVTVHDLIPLTPFWGRSIIKQKIFLFYLQRIVRYSTKIITVSNYTANELKHRFRGLNGKIEVIHNFINDKFVNLKSPPSPIVNNPYILFIGNRKKHKNLETLIKVFAKIKDSIPHHIVIAGTRDKKQEEDEIDSLIKKLNIQNRVVQLTEPDDQTIINLYSFADVFVFPSLIEGFGFPPLEAVSLGCPAILSDIPVLREIFDDSGLYFNPYSEDDLANTILKIILDKELRNNLLKKQKGRIKLFNKDEIVKQYIQLFEHLSGGNI
jgi:glycosyltransferase involved in cell wall biosynthesis